MVKEIVHVEPNDVWDYFVANKFDLSTNMHLIAENDDYGIEIYLTDDKGEPNIVVMADNSTIYDETCISKDDCYKTVLEIYATYLTESAVAKFLEDVPYDDELYEEELYNEIDLEIEEREDDLSYAVRCCLDEFVGGEGIHCCSKDADEIIEDVKNIICELLYLKYDIDPRRPSVIQYDDGTEEFEEYPYSKLKLENANNAIFLKKVNNTIRCKKY